MRYNSAMDLTNINDLKLAMQLAGLRAQKGLGQHFLVDRDSLEAVITAGELVPTDHVIEIGPGLGVMTAPLTERVAQVTAVEMDSRLADLLQQDKPDNLTVLNQDVMQLDLRSLPPQYKVIANIPYYLTSAIIRLFLEAPQPPQIMSLLIQKEVAERIVAKPGKMSVLAFSVQYYGAARLVQVVEHFKFWPAPKVDSAILQVKVYDAPLFAADRDALFRLVKAGFGEKRKQMKNSLAGGLNISMELAAELIAKAKLTETARAQELSMAEWERLYQVAMAAKLLA